VCFVNGPGRVTNLLMLDAACVVLIVWMASDITLLGAWGSPQEVIVLTARLLRGEKCR
jgi:hypothetical protein